MTADLHVHTNVSDGAYMPEKIVALAVQQGLKTIAITDHDTVKGIGRALRAGMKLDLTVIPGIEFSTELGEQEIHILGYHIRYWEIELQQTLRKLKRERSLRIWKMYQQIKKLGLEVTWQEIADNVGHGTLGRPHLARALVKRGYVDSIEEAFAIYLGRGCPAYIPRPKLTPKSGIRLIRQSGGVPVLAHPGHNLGFFTEPLIKKLVHLGLAGIEVFYPTHDKATTLRLFRLAKKNNLCITGGSDYHGPDVKGAVLGSSVVTQEQAEELKKRINW
ncbi:MAG: PHP domain-containing protein [bacterium]|jgi:predicted metal-dependent phosphoesterase TrpH